MSAGVETLSRQESRMPSVDYSSLNRNSFIQELVNNNMAFASAMFEFSDFTMEYIRLKTSPHYFGNSTPKSNNSEPVLLVQGFLAPALSMVETSLFLKRLGYKTYFAFPEQNIMRTHQLKRVEDAIINIAENTGRKVNVVGQSAGGTFGFLADMRISEKFENGELTQFDENPVGQLFTLGSPIGAGIFEEQQTPASALFVRRLAEQYMRSDPTGKSLTDLGEYLYKDVPDSYSVTGYISRNDRIVPRAFSLRDDVEIKEARSPHTGMGIDIDILTDIGKRLAA